MFAFTFRSPQAKDISMRINNGVKGALVAAATGLLLTACSSDAEPEATATAAAESGSEFAAIAEDIDTRTGCDAFGGVWAAGEAGEGVAEVYTCDVDGDGAAETTLTLYATHADLEADLANVEAASDATAIVTSETYVVATTDSSHLASISATDVEVVRELPVAE